MRVPIKRGLSEMGLETMMITRFKAPTVAPHTGAWIETTILRPGKSLQSVAPHTGAWIETLSPFLFNFLLPSLPIRERGLKRRRSVNCELVGYVKKKEVVK